MKFYWTAIISFAISLAISLVTGLPCAEYTLLAQQAYFHPRGKLAMLNGFSVYYRGCHLKEMSQNQLLLTPEKSLTMKQHRSPPNNSNGIVSVSFSYRSPIVLLSFSYCSPIVLLLGSGIQYGNNTETIRNRTNEERMRNGGTRVVNLTIV